jgi:hypothetical protein
MRMRNLWIQACLGLLFAACSISCVESAPTVDTSKASGKLVPYG